ncbi:MAG: hypothetical protein J6V53_03050 [Alphaproteobacteria bacterium]|nr:hypothetical protein [Alphaproteobacteria bacterium]
MQTKTLILTPQQESSFWTRERKFALQDELDQAFQKEAYCEKKCKQEGLLLQGLSILGALLVYAFNKNSFDLNAQLSFSAMVSGVLLARLRQARKQAMIKEVLCADGIFSFFGKEGNKLKDMAEIEKTYQEADNILDFMFFKAYTPTRNIALISSGILAGCALTDQMSAGVALLSGVSLLGLTQAYDLIHAKRSIKKIKKALPLGVYLPRKQNERA